MSKYSYMSEKEATAILETIETFVELSQLSLKELFCLQRMIGYAIEEKLNSSNTRMEPPDRLEML